jgi:hypothetical protein
MPKPEMIVTLRFIRHEVPCTDPRGRPAYRWAPRYIVIHPDGTEEHGPVTRSEGYARARELGATKVEVI